MFAAKRKYTKYAFEGTVFRHTYVRPGLRCKKAMQTYLVGKVQTYVYKGR
jgi:hypothetical protein